ncbi:MAG: hypothetical protein SNJ71_04640 [Bacteroidales bacterium]
MNNYRVKTNRGSYIMNFEPIVQNLGNYTIIGKSGFQTVKETGVGFIPTVDETIPVLNKEEIIQEVTRVSKF